MANDAMLLIAEQMDFSMAKLLQLPGRCSNQQPPSFSESERHLNDVLDSVPRRSPSVILRTASQR